jgi:serine/threonine-protein kinase
MATVYLAHDSRLERKVALKVLAPELAQDDEFRGRFTQEMRLAAALDHPGVVPVFDAGEIEGVLYIAMRFVDGQSLSEVLAAGPLAPDRASSIIRQLGAALDAAHARGLVHRDVKPGNVLLVPGIGPEGTDHVYLSDFGLAKPTAPSESYSRAGVAYGTLGTMAPEQLEGKPVDARADVYALACVAFELLTGTPPFRRETAVATAAAHLHEAPPSASAFQDGLPTQVDAVIARAMSKSKHDRDRSAGAFADSFAGALLRPPDTSSSPVEVRRERRIVTVLFCDIVGSTGLTDGLDPEDVDDLLGRYRTLAHEVLVRYGGTVEKFVGDAVMAVFGVPVAHDDDAERAIRAGLQLIDALGHPTSDCRFGSASRAVRSSHGSAPTSPGAKVSWSAGRLTPRRGSSRPRR